MKKNLSNERKTLYEDKGFLSEFAKKVRDYEEFLMQVASQGAYECLDRDFFERTKDILQVGDEFVSKCRSKKEIKELKKYFRMIVLPLACKSVIVRRGYEKPRGYAGDYATLEMIYDNREVSDCIVGKLFDRYLLNDPYVVAVRNRKEKMQEFLSISVTKSLGKDKLRILNIASGGARDIRDLFSENKEIRDNKNIEIVLIDQDEEALDFSKQQIGLIESQVRCTHVNENISNFFINQSRIEAFLGRFDVVYSIGLIDYISDLLLHKLIKFCFDLLLPDGRFFLAVKNTKVFKSLASDWFCDWNFYLRDHNDLARLVEQALEGRRFRIEPIEGKDSYISFVSIIKA